MLAHWRIVQCVCACCGSVCCVGVTLRPWDWADKCMCKQFNIDKRQAANKTRRQATDSTSDTYKQFIQQQHDKQHTSITHSILTSSKQQHDKQQATLTHSILTRSKQAARRKQDTQMTSNSQQHNKYICTCSKHTYTSAWCVHAHAHALIDWFGYIIIH